MAKASEKPHVQATTGQALTGVILLVLAWLVLAWPWLSGSVTVPWDAKAHFQPQLQFLAQSLHAGRSPFWAPHVFAGHPQIADPQSLIFSPPYLLLALFDRDPGFVAADTVLLATLLLGGLAILMLFRDRGWHQAGALVAALAFMFGGGAAWRLQHTGQVLSLAYWPIALWLLDRALRGGRGFGSRCMYGLGAGVVAGIMVMGRDQIAVLGTYLLIAFALSYVFGARGRILSSIGPLVAAAVGGLVVIVVPLALTLALAMDSNRTAIDLAGAERGSLHPAALITAVIPHLYGISRPLSDFWGPPSPDWDRVFGNTNLYVARNMATVYFGILPVLAIAAIGFGRRVLLSRESAFFACALIAMIIYALGRYTPMFAILFDVVPGVAMFRRPADAVFLMGALGAIAGGYAVHRWLSMEHQRLPWPLWILLLGAAALIFSLAVWYAQAVGRTDQVLAPIASAALLLAAAAVLLILLARHRERSLAVSVAVVLFMVADLGWNNAPNESTALDPATYDVLRADTTNETIAIIRKRLAETAAPDRRDRVELAGVDFHWPNASLVHGFDHTLGYNPLRLRIFADATGAGDQIAVPDQKQFSPLMPSYRSPLANLLGLRLIVSRVPIEQLDRSLAADAFPLIARTTDGYIYENQKALPRVLFATRIERADTRALLERGGWPDVDPTQTVLLESAAPRSFAGTGSARILSYGTTEIMVEVRSDGGGVLVLNDVWHPWWSASIEGRAVPIARANVMFRGVEVPAGTHRVRFAFEPLRGLLRALRGHTPSSAM